MLNNNQNENFFRFVCDYYNLFNQFFQKKNVIKVIKIISLISWENRPTQAQDGAYTLKKR